MKNIRENFSHIKDRFDSINSSKLVRAMQTANIALELGLDLGENQDDEEIFDEEKIKIGFENDLDKYDDLIKRDERFNEFNFGPMEGSEIVDMDHQEHYDLFRQ